MFATAAAAGIVMFGAVETALAAGASVDVPAVTWASYPVGAGDHVLLHGGAWGKDVRVLIDGGKVCPATVLSDTGLVFPFPCDEEKIVEGRVVDDSGKSAPFALNMPTPWWLQGDAGDSSTPGGTLRLFGRSLAPYGKSVRGKPRVMLGEKLRDLGYDAYSLKGGSIKKFAVISGKSGDSPDKLTIIII